MLLLSRIIEIMRAWQLKHLDHLTRDSCNLRDLSPQLQTEQSRRNKFSYSCPFFKLKVWWKTHRLLISQSRILWWNRYTSSIALWKSTVFFQTEWVTLWEPIICMSFSYFGDCHIDILRLREWQLFILEMTRLWGDLIVAFWYLKVAYKKR